MFRCRRGVFSQLCGGTIAFATKELMPLRLQTNGFDPMLRG